MSIPLKRRTSRAWLGLCGLLLVLQGPAHGLMGIRSGGKEPVEDQGWPKGVLEFANHSSRFRWVHVQGNFGWEQYWLEYRGDAKAFNEALRVFSKIRAPGLELVIRDGPGRPHWGDEDKKNGVDWTFSPKNPRAFHRYYNNDRWGRNDEPLGAAVPLPPPRIEVFIGNGGKIDWSRVQVPAGISVRDRRAASVLGKPSSGGVLLGSVYDVYSGKPVVGARVFVVPGRGDESSESTPVLKTNEDGDFQLRDIKQGYYTVHVEAEGYAPYNAGGYSNEGNSLEQKVVYPAKAVSVEGTVIDPDGKPISGVQVQVSMPIGFDGRAYPLVHELEPITTDGDGRFRMSGLPEGRVRIGLAGEGKWWTWLHDYYPAPAKDVRIMAYPTGTVRGRVVDRQGIPFPAGVRVLLIRRGECLDRFITGEPIGEDGAFVLTGVPPGEYMIGQNRGVLYDGTDPAAKPVVVKPGKASKVEVVFPDSAWPKDKPREERKPVRLAGKKAPPLEVDGLVPAEAATLESLRGKVTVLVFWSVEDGASDRLVPVLNRQIQSGVQVVTVHRADVDPSNLKSYLEKNRCRFPVMVDRSGSATFRRYGVRNLPAVFIIGPGGAVEYQDIPPPAIPRAVKALSR